MPAERLFLALGLVTLLLPGAVLLPWLALVVLTADLALVAAFAVDLRRARREIASLAGERTWPRTLMQHAPDRLETALTHGGGRRLRVRLREGLHPALAGGPAATEVELAPGQTARWPLDVVPRRRGEHRAGPLTARVLGPWRLAWGQGEVLGEQPVRVYPQVRWEGRVGQLLALAQRRRLGQVRQHLHGAGSELYALRDYVPGDPLGRIHWKATARFGRPIAREDTWERSARLVVLLDAARAMASVEPGEPGGPGGGPSGRSKLDHALAATLALARVAVARGDAVTVIAFSDRIERRVRLRSPGRDIALAYAALYDLDARLAEPAYDLAAEVALESEPRGATVVLLSSVVDLAAAELLRGALLALERRHRPLLVNLEDPELTALADRPPDTPAEAFAQAAALEIALANRRLAKRLRHAGIRAVSAPADRLALETLEAYLNLFRGRGRSGAPRPASRSPARAETQARTAATAVRTVA